MADKPNSTVSRQILILLSSASEPDTEPYHKHQPLCVSYTVNLTASDILVAVITTKFHTWTTCAYKRY